jgi:protein-disulfide isomerase
LDDLSELRADEAAIGVVFFDYGCEFCRTIAPYLLGRVATSERVGIRLRYLPRPGDVHARSAALAAICAEVVGRFEMVHQLLTRDAEQFREPGEADVVSVLHESDRVRYSECLASERGQQQLKRDSVWAHRLGIRATPTFVFPSARFYRGSDTSQIERLMRAHKR